MNDARAPWRRNFELTLARGARRRAARAWLPHHPHADLLRRQRRPDLPAGGAGAPGDAPAPGRSARRRGADPEYPRSRPVDDGPGRCLHRAGGGSSSPLMLADYYAWRTRLFRVQAGRVFELKREGGVRFERVATLPARAVAFTEAEAEQLGPDVHARLPAASPAKAGLDRPAPRGPAMGPPVGRCDGDDRRIRTPNCALMRAPRERFAVKRT